MRQHNQHEHPQIRDYGGEPFVFNIEHASAMNENFRLTLWTGKDIQMTLMSIPVGGDIGVEMHDNVDQFIRIECGRARVLIGTSPDSLEEIGCFDDSYAILIPRGTWHNIINVGVRPLKLYSLYAPPQHPSGTVHKTKEDAEHAHG